MKYAFAFATTALVLAAAGAAAAEDCFRTQDMRNHTVVDDRTLYVAVGNKDVYRLQMSGSCLASAHSSDALVIKTTGGSGLICRPLDLSLGVKIGGGPPSACIVDKISKLTPEEVAAIPKGLRP